MADTIYCKEDIKKRLEGYLEDYKLQLSLWEKVELVKKKDGSNFAYLTKSFNNATYGNADWSTNNLVYPKITVYGRSDKTGYRNYDLDCYLYLDDMKKAGDSRYTGQALTNGCVRAVYHLNADEIYQMIQDYIVHLKRTIARYEDQLKALEVVFPVINEKVQDLKATIKDLTSSYKDDIFPSSLEYALYDYVKQAIR